MLSEKAEAVAKSLEPDRNKFWNISPEVGKFLWLMLRMLSAKRVLEIGTSNGYSAIWMADAVSDSGGKVYTVESNAERFVLASQNIAKAGLSEFVFQVKGHAPEILESVEEIKGIVFDLVFLDATKMEHFSYLAETRDKLRVGGLLVVDNVLSHKKHLADFCEYVESQQEFESSILDFGTGAVLVARKLPKGL